MKCILYCRMPKIGDFWSHGRLMIETALLWDFLETSNDDYWSGRICKFEDSLYGHCQAEEWMEEQRDQELDELRDELERDDDNSDDGTYIRQELRHLEDERDAEIDEMWDKWVQSVLDDKELFDKLIELRIISYI